MRSPPRLLDAGGGILRRDLGADRDNEHPALEEGDPGKVALVVPVVGQVDRPSELAAPHVRHPASVGRGAVARLLFGAAELERHLALGNDFCRHPIYARIKSKRGSLRLTFVEGEEMENHFSTHLEQSY